MGWVERAARVNAAMLREFAEDVLVECGSAPAVTVSAVPLRRDQLEGEIQGGVFEGVELDVSLLPLGPARGDFVTLYAVRYLVESVSRPDPTGLTRLTLSAPPAGVRR